MANFSIKEQEDKIVGKATFEKITDFKAIRLKADDKVYLLHAVQADKLIAKKAATLEKDIKIKQGAPTMTVTEMEKK